MKTGYVYHLIHVRTPHEYIAKLFITNCPDKLTEKELQNQLDSRYDFREFNASWSNYHVDFNLRAANKDIKRAWRSGEVETIDYNTLNDDDLPE